MKLMKFAQKYENKNFQKVKNFIIDRSLYFYTCLFAFLRQYDLRDALPFVDLQPFLVRQYIDGFPRHSDALTRLR